MAGIGTYKPIKLIKYITSLSAAGDSVETLAKIYKMWSEVKSLGGSRSLQKEQTALSDTKTFKIMFKDYPINADFKIQYFGQIYAISSIERIDEKRFNWLITAYNIFKQPALLPDPAESPGGGGGGGGGDTITNWTDFTYNQQTGEFIFTGGTGVAGTQVSFFASPYTGFNYINGWNEGVGGRFLPAGINSMIEDALTQGPVNVKFRRTLSTPPYTVLTPETMIELQVTRLPERKYILESTDNEYITAARFPVYPINVLGVELALANNIDEYMSIMNADPNNAQCFELLSYQSTGLRIDILVAPISPYQDYGVWNRHLRVRRA